ncbi:hypothetical protein EDD16DRAFT_1539090 [Pisolithus croceorrhizus]|nr:hypothetical protein EDD16DRAFT_1539090 [Pisolithus croceorrhizus]KAI6159866.1 hypothetical protein EDD17DRAFT_1608426 [Pisolithus thermaeus]
MSRNTAATSPSIPTPSLSTGDQTADGVPNEAFEALIDLLASDGIDDVPPTSSVPRARITADGAALRDESGRLDFEKICSMFQGQNHAESQGETPVEAVQPDQQVLDSLGGGAQTDVDPPRDIVEDTVTLKANPITATVQNSRPDRSRYPDVDSAAHSNDVQPLRNVLTTPFSFDQLNDALGSARDEMRTLRRQYDELQKLVAERLGKGKERKMTQETVSGAQDSKPCRNLTAPSDLRVPAAAVRDGTKTGPQTAIAGGSDHGPKQDGDDGIATEVAQLSEEEAKRALTAIASITNVRPSLLLSGDPNSAPSNLSPRTRGNLNPQDISRALDFVERVDEIIWKRSSIPISSSLDPVFTAGNVEGLLSRLELWEQMVRGPSA